MWKNKHFLKGLGIGLIAAAVLLQLMLTVKQADSGTLNKMYSQEQLDEAVRKAVKEEKPPEPTKEAPPEKVTVYIYDKMSAANVADYLNRSGIIADRDAFQNELSARNLEGKIRSNLYSFHLNENIEEVIKAITPPSQ